MNKVEWLMEDSSVSKYMGKLSPNTQRNNLYVLNSFITWVRENRSKFSEATLNDLVELQKNAGNGDQYEILDILQEWINSLSLRHGTKKNNYNTIRGFFKSNRAPLPQDDFKIKGDKPRVQGKLTPANIRDMVLSSNAMYRAVWLCMFQGGMGQDELVYWSNQGYEKLKEDLKADPDLIKVDLPGRKAYKNRRHYYTLISGDALQALKDWVKERPENTSAIFCNQFGEPLTKYAMFAYWMRHLRELNLIKAPENAGTSTRYGLNPHELRDCFRSQWEKSPAMGSVAEFMMGHIVDELGYNKAHMDESWVLEEYRKALPMLQIMSSGNPFGRVDRSEIQRLEAYVENQSRRIEDQARIIDSMRAEKLESNGELAKFREEFEEFKKVIKELSTKQLQG